MIPRAGQLLLLALLLAVMFLFYVRPDTRDGDGPILLAPIRGQVLVELVVNEGPARICQFIDTATLAGVIKVTGFVPMPALLEDRRLQQRLKEGASLSLVVQMNEVQAFSLDWMSAAKRITLGIPLHPDRMSEQDWQVLPGVGAKMAARFENDRQNNGEFGDFCSLVRVPGVGLARLTAWNQYFFKNSEMCK